jgi:hypothetical protein
MRKEEAVGPRRRVRRTACWECVWMHAVAERRVKAFQKRGVQADSLRPWV